MNRKLLTCAGFVLSILAVGQINNFPLDKRKTLFSAVSPNGNWVKFRADKSLRAASVIMEHKDVFGLSKDDEVKLFREETDNLGMEHFRFRQFYKSVPVEGAEFTVHGKDGSALTGNGWLASQINTTTQPVLSAKQAIQVALDYVHATHYLWEDAEAQRTLKLLKNNSAATFYPDAELVITKSELESDELQYKLAYKLDVYASEPLIGKTIYVDAESGQLLYTLELIHTTDVGATAVTKYSGNHTIITDSVNATSYRLREAGRGSGIQTTNMQNGLYYGKAVDFTDADNYWNNVNGSFDEVATDVHWASEMTYDYYLQTFNRKSFDNNNIKLLAFVHFSIQYVNAFYNGYWLTYGDGNGTAYKPLTSVDIVGHEITHGVTAYSCGLIYQYESGALNESFSDIFGTCVEYFAKPLTANWTLAEDIGPGFRSMSNPKAFNNPDTYNGKFYYIGSLDYGGVHTNSGVQNHWFYLLSDGGTGVNDLGNSFNIPGIGKDKAMKIAYRNLTVYMNKYSKYMDAREGSILAAQDLFGVCSTEAIQTANAWNAVGVGGPVSNNDVSLAVLKVPNHCGLTATEVISAYIVNKACVPLSSGDTLFASYTIDKAQLNSDTLVLTGPLQPGDSLKHVFKQKADLSVVGGHKIASWISLKGDSLHYNDTIRTVVENRVAQNTDLAMLLLDAPRAGCQLGANETVRVKFRFKGCDSMVSGEKIPLAYRINKGLIVRDTVTLSKSLKPADTLVYSFQSKADLSNLQSYYFDCWTDYAADTMHKNDSIIHLRINKPVDIGSSIVTFEDSLNVMDSLYTITNLYSQVYITKTASNLKSKYGIRMTGGDWFTNRWSHKGINDLTTWTVNNDFAASSCFCVDASAWTKVYLQFDMKQTYNTTLSSQTGYLDPRTSNLRVTINGTQIGQTYNPKFQKADKFVTHVINLNAYAGSSFTACFETKNYVADEYDIVSGGSGLGDNAFLDNVRFMQDSITGIKEDVDAAMEFLIYPNPAKDQFTLFYSSAEQGVAGLEVVDMLGRAVLIEKENIHIGPNALQIRTGILPSGIYSVRLLSGTAVGVKKLLVE